MKELAGKGAQKGEIDFEGEGAAVCGGEADCAGEGVFAGADPFVCGVLCGIGGSGEDGEVVGSVGGGVADCEEV